MTSSTHYSEDFLNLLDIWPKCYLGFPASEIRGQALSKSYMILENVTQHLVIFRVSSYFLRRSREDTKNIQENILIPMRKHRADSPRTKLFIEFEM